MVSPRASGTARQWLAALATFGQVKVVLSAALACLILYGFVVPPWTLATNDVLLFEDVAAYSGADARCPNGSRPALEQLALRPSSNQRAWLLTPRLIWGAATAEVAVVFVSNAQDKTETLAAAKCYVSCGASKAGGSLPWWTAKVFSDTNEHRQLYVTRILHCPVDSDAAARCLRDEFAGTPATTTGAGWSPAADDRFALPIWAMSKSLTLHLSGSLFGDSALPVQVPATWPRLLARTADLDDRSKASVTLCYCPLHTVRDWKYTAVQYLPEVLEHYIGHGVQQIVLPVSLTSDVVPGPLVALLQYYNQQDRRPRLVAVNSTGLWEPATWYHGQTASMMDCALRYRDRPRIVLFGDVDELVWAAKPWRLADYLRQQLADAVVSHEQTGAAVVVNEVSPQEDRVKATAVVNFFQLNLVTGICFPWQAVRSPGPLEVQRARLAWLQGLERAANQSETSWPWHQYADSAYAQESRVKLAAVTTLIAFTRIHTTSLRVLPGTFDPVQQNADPADAVKLHVRNLGTGAPPCSYKRAEQQYRQSNFSLLKPLAFSATATVEEVARQHNWTRVRLLADDERYWTQTKPRAALARQLMGACLLKRAWP